MNKSCFDIIAQVAMTWKESLQRCDISTLILTGKLLFKFTSITLEQIPYLPSYKTNHTA